MAQARMATASVAITPTPFSFIAAPPEGAALKKRPPGAVESSRPGGRAAAPGCSGWSVIPSEVVGGQCH